MDTTQSHWGLMYLSLDVFSTLSLDLLIMAQMPHEQSLTSLMPVMTWL